MNVKNVVLIKASESRDVSVVANKIDEQLRREGIHVEHMYSFYHNIDDPPLLQDNIDLAIAIGGDGTVLKAARICAHVDKRACVPILPIKVGDFGFISEIQQDEWKESFDLLRQGKIEYTEHTLICVQVKDRIWYACNDVTIYTNLYGTIKTVVHCNKEFLTKYRSDGLIVTTPIGSTAHSLSSGGPIIMPGMKNMMINPIAPFTISHRPLVVPMDYCIDIELERQQRRDAFLIVDGFVVLGLKGGFTCCVKNAGRSAKIIKSHKRTYFEVLRSKLKWTGTL